MMTRKIEKDLRLIAVKAKEFPDGVVPAFKDLENRLEGGPKGRKFYGISRGDGGKNIVYWACALAKDREVIPSGCEELTAKAGVYNAEQISNWRGREEILGQTFQKMIADPGIDPQGYCVEEYLDNGDVICMVRILRPK
jgi:hypothetical protein